MKNRFLAIFSIVLAVLVGIQHGVAAGLVCATLAGATLMPTRTGCLHAVGPLNLLDIALRSGKGVHAVLEGVLTYAPELAIFKALAKAGLSYSTLTCTALPAGDFRPVGGGVGLQKTEWKREVGSMVPFEAQMRVPEDVLIAARAEQADLTDGDVLASESIRTMKGSTLRIGSQIWYGAKISADGFAGLSTQVDTANNEVNAGGATNTDTSSVYLVDTEANPVNPEGVHLVIGNGGRMNFKDTWGTQQIEVSSGKFATIFTNNFLAYLGLAVPRAQAVYRVKNINAANPFKDETGADLLAKVPLALRADKSRWRWFMNSAAALTLQKSRQGTITTDKGVGATGAFPAEPTSCQGIQIQLTDSLLTTERNGLKP